MVAVLDCDSAGRIGFLGPCINADSIGFWFHAPMNDLTLWTKVFAARIATEAKAEADRIARRQRPRSRPPGSPQRPRPWPWPWPQRPRPLGGLPRRPWDTSM